MKIINGLEHSENPTSVALGFFDGVHRGHAAVIGEAVAYAKKNNLVATVFTMLQRPHSVITGENLNSIITLDEKLSIFEKIGVEQVYVADFNDIRGLYAKEFIENVIIGCFNAKHTVCGFNYHFGSGGSGNGEMLREYGIDKGITVTTLPHIDYKDLPVSSTRIRKSISSGKIDEVNAMLGHKYGFCLPIIHGRQLGRTMGTPTLNQKFPDGLVYPKFGVYASTVLVDGKSYCGVTNIGIKPTVGSECVLIETWMPDYCGRELYDESIDVRLLQFIRAEKKFDNIQILKEEILKNAEFSKQQQRDAAFD